MVGRSENRLHPAPGPNPTAVIALVGASKRASREVWLDHLLRDLVGKGAIACFGVNPNRDNSSMSDSLLSLA